MRQRYVGNAGIQQLHERRQSQRQPNPPWIHCPPARCYSVTHLRLTVLGSQFAVHSWRALLAVCCLQLKVRDQLFGSAVKQPITFHFSPFTKDGGWQVFSEGTSKL